MVEFGVGFVAGMVVMWALRQFVFKSSVIKAEVAKAEDFVKKV